MKKIFVDLGGNKGQSIKAFLDNYPNASNFEIHTFEPTPDLWNTLRQYPAILHKEVVWTYDGKIDFYFARLSDGSTAIKGKRTGGVNYNNPQSLLCMDFARWIRDHKDDYLLIKMNIEGSEYPILKHLIKNDVIKYIDELYVQFHHDKITGIEREDSVELDNYLKKHIKKYNTIPKWENFIKQLKK